MPKTSAPTRTKARKGKPAPEDVTATGKPARTKRARADTAAEASPGSASKRRNEPRTGTDGETPRLKAARHKTTGKAAEPSGKASAKKSGKRAATRRDRTEAGSAPVAVQAGSATPAGAASERPGKGEGKPGGGKSVRGKPGGGKRRPAQQTFLVAATLAPKAGAPALAVYAVVTRTPAEALAAVRGLLGTDLPVGLTGKLSGRMAKALGLEPGEVRRI